MNTISFLFCAHMFVGKRASQIFTLEAEQGFSKALIRASYDTWLNYHQLKAHEFPVSWKMTHEQSHNWENID